MMRPDLNDYVTFAEVVAHGGFTAAGRALREPKSKLSRRVSALEARLGVRLIERSSRRFRVTEVGQTFYERCRAIMLEAERAEALIAEAQAEPHGRIRMSCPRNLVKVVSAIVRGFLDRFPKVQLQLVVTDRAVDLIEERIDVALRVRHELTSDASLTMRSLGRSRWILVASPRFANGLGAGLAELASVPTMGTSDEVGETTWMLEREDGTAHVMRHEPRLTCADYAVLCDAAADGLGVAFLPDHACAAHIDAGRLVRVFRDWRSRDGIVHLVFTTHRGLPPGVRSLIDHLAGEFPDL
ncbi:LysR family transcriptional regulator [Methylobacterium sp. WL103]|jgi:DNA-binding transcriptional LysR family regulator|uniref:LysR substrate-binding domain-containing protein n=1 Tax=unclassified Methylobacterium TaxID=2615210 RepID=UPI0011C897C2|nr:MULTISPECIES: LysR substrate-binding domain-containing protein [unclassified Methylobacterium]MCJ2044068.1 LysR substrate-binding domain-containing protein [Methylobacterium sp. J-078]TXN07669.1 LysR family transcriptional regulator [Methylobacterium sp. WL103]